MKTGFTYLDFLPKASLHRVSIAIALARHTKGLALSQMTRLQVLVDRTRHAYSYYRPAMYATAQTIICFRRIVEFSHVGQVIRWRSTSDSGVA